MSELGRIIQDIWIVNNGGSVLFQRLFDSRVNADLLGGFFSALNSFALQFDKNGLTGIEMNNKRFVIAKHKDVLFVSNCEKVVLDKDAQKELLRIVDLFLKEYPPEVYQTGEIEPKIFENFLTKIDTSLDTAVDQFHQAFW